MDKRVISITGINDLYAFVREASRVVGDVIVSRGKFSIDGKSIMGLMSIDTSVGVTVEYPADATDFASFIEQYTV